jgi:hypothetical protein
MSTDSREQEDSIPQQKAWARDACAREGIDLPREAVFEDHGVTGTKTAKRKDLHAMLAYCRRRHQEKRPVEVIVCWNTKRFSRADQQETDWFIWEFRKVGVCRMFTRDGWIDFRKAQDRLLYGLNQELGNRGESVTRAKDILRGKRDAADRGTFNGGPLPYACDRVWVDGLGQEVMRIRRGERRSYEQAGCEVYACPFPEDDPDPARQEARRTVAKLFAWYVEKDRTGDRTLARWLNDQGVPGPGSDYAGQVTKWSPDAVKDVLTNPVYCGLARWGKTAAGAIVRNDNGKDKDTLPDDKRTFNQEGVYLRPLPWPGVVSKEVWERAQRKREGRKRAGVRVREKGFILSSPALVHCGHCGGPMFGHVQDKKYRDSAGRARRYVYRYYVCDTGQIKPGACRLYAVREDRLIRALVKKLLDVYLDPDRLEGLRVKLREKAEARREKDPRRLARLEAKLAQLDREIQTGVKALMAYPDNADLLNAELTGKRQERQGVEKELEALRESQAVPAGQALAEIERAVGKLLRLRKRLVALGANPDAAGYEELGAVLRLLVSHVDCYFDTEAPHKPRQPYAFLRGVVRFRPVLDFSEGSGETFFFSSR